MPRLPPPFQLAAVVALAPLLAAADGGPSLDDLLQTEVQGVSRQIERTLDAPATVYILQASTAAALGHETLTDMLNRLPGVYIGSQRSYATVGLRGFSRPGDYNARVLMSLDGMRVNDGVFDQALPGLEFPVAMPWIKRVELVGGPAGSVYGSNALLGVVNVVTFDASDLPGWRTHVAAGGQSSREWGASWGHVHDGTDLLVGVQFHDRAGESLRLPELAGPDRPEGWVHGLDGERAHHALMKLRRGAWRLSLGSQGRHKEAATAPYGSLPGAPGTRLVDHYGYGELVYDPGWRASWRPSLRASLVRSRFDGRYVYDDGAGGTVANTDVVASNVGTVDARLMWRGWINHELTAGIEGRRVAGARQRNADEDPVAVYLDRADGLSQWGLYAQDRWALAERQTLNVGLRLDWPQGFDPQASPRMAWVWRPAEGESLKLLLGRAFRVPNLAERHYEDGATQIANPDLKPERVTHGELAWERMLGPGVRVALSAYHYRLAELIDFVSIAPELAQYQNAGAPRATGADVEMQVRKTGGLRWRVSASWVRATLGEDTLSHSPRWLLKGHLLLPLAAHWTLGLQGQAMSRRSAPLGDVPGWGTVDAALTGRWGGQSLTLRVVNLADAEHAEPGSPENGLSRVPGERRRWLLIWRASY